MTLKNKTLIYDSNESGHLPDYLEYIYDYFNENLIDNQYECLVSERVFKDFKINIERNLSQKHGLNINVIDENIQKTFNGSSNLIQRTFLEKQYLEDYCYKNEITKIIFLQIDAYQLIIGIWGFTKFRKTLISGIFFQPYIQLKKVNTIFSFLKKFRKKKQLQFMLLNQSVQTLFILNDYNAVEQFKGEIKNENVFKFIPDPIKIRNFNKIEIREKYRIDKSKKLLLFIGGIQKRKNLISIIKAISILPDDLKRITTLLILGKSDDTNLINGINTEINKEKIGEIIFENNFVYKDEFESAIIDSDLVFTIYSDFYCSSAVIGNVAKHGKDLIGSDLGVISDIIDRFNLGLKVNPESITDISISINKYLQEDIKYNLNQNIIIQGHHWTLFVRTLIS